MENATAKVSCFVRAYHYENHSPRVFDDPAARPLLGADYDQIAQSMCQGIGFFLPDFRGSAEEGLRLIVERQLAPSVLGRSAFCEAALKSEKRLGCRQYAIFASGYDTFAIRNRDTSLAVFEFDLPEVLADKRLRAERAGLTSCAADIPCDLSESSWGERLLQGGFNPAEKAFASLLGISYYLDRDAFRGLLKTLGEILRDGSAVCFDYPSKADSREARTHRALAQGAGEPMKARYALSELESLLEACGFLICEHLNPSEMTRRFFADYNEAQPAHAMPAPEGVGYVLAVRKT